jgi:hypothetical protein
MSKQRNQRRTILIDRGFQLRFISRLGGALLFYLLLFLVISIVAPVAFTFLGDPPEWALMETAFRVEVLLRLILAPLFCTFLCLFAHGILETFRIAGPNYRFKAVLREVKRLRVPRGVQVRKGDYLRDTASEFDQALVAIHDAVLSLKAASREASRKVRDVLAGAATEESREAMAAVARVEQDLARFELCGQAPACQSQEATPVEPMTEDAIASAR